MWHHQQRCVIVQCNYPPTKSEGYSFGVVRASVHPSVHSVRPSVRNHISVPIGQIWFCQCDRQCRECAFSIDACQINALGSMNVGLMQICTPLSSHDKNQIHVHNHACVHIDCERVCDHWAFPYGNLSTLILIPTLPKLTAYFSVISFQRLLNQENAHMRVFDMENFYTMPMYLFLNHWIWARNHMGWWSSQMWPGNAQESLRFCAIFSRSGCSLTQSF